MPELLGPGVSVTAEGHIVATADDGLSVVVSLDPAGMRRVAATLQRVAAAVEKGERLSGHRLEVTTR